MLLYQVNTRVLLRALSEKLNRDATLDDIDDDLIHRWQSIGFKWIWFLSVWETGEASRSVSRSHPQWLEDFHATLPDLTERDIVGSGFAIKSYHVHERLGGDAALERLRQRLNCADIRVMLDFVPNHVAIDHPWVEEHPEYCIEGDERLLDAQPKNYFRLQHTSHRRILAHGRDPYFPGWPDTVQLNYSNCDLQTAMCDEIVRIATQCDGVRCDMAMLLLPNVFEQTWRDRLGGKKIESYWERAIAEVRERNDDFVFMAEVYWDLEWTLQQLGFDYAYDKRLYDRLLKHDASSIRDHLRADIAYQSKLVRFLENHDEQRINTELSLAQHTAAAVITSLTPGLTLLHQGQIQGYRKRISPHLGRGPEEETDPQINEMYQKLLEIIRSNAWMTRAHWRLVESATIPFLSSACDIHKLVIFVWEIDNAKQRSPGEATHLVVIVNYSDQSISCRLDAKTLDPLLSKPGSGSGNWTELWSTERQFERDTLPAWGVFIAIRH